MFRKVSDFVKDWQEESQLTYSLLKLLKNEALSKKVYNEGRTLGDLSWHIVASVAEMGTEFGIPIKNFNKDMENPNNVDEFCKLYKQYSEELLNYVSNNWTDESLEEEMEVYGEKWKKGFGLDVIIRHQAHHRGQMTILMRQAGLPIIGVYGPTKEEWAKYNMPPLP